MDNNKNIAEPGYLRQKAEGLLISKQSQTSAQLSEPDMLRLIHELEVHQIELEMQNEELVLAKENAELAEKKYIELYDFAPSGYLTLTANGEIAGLNFMASRILGKERKLLIKNKFGLFITEDTRTEFNQFFKHIFTSDVKQICDVTIATEGNRPIYVNIDGIISHNNQQCFLILTDITSLKLTEIEINKAKEAAELATKIAENAKLKAEGATQIAEDAMKAKQQFLSNMSHEIRTPMNAIIGFTKVLLKTDLSAKQKEYLSAIKMSGDALIVLINDILDLAKVDAGKMSFKQIPFKMASSISAMLHLFEPKIQEKNLVLIKNYDLRIPEVLVGDPVRLHQIILNLVSNSVKFTSQGIITVSVYLLEENNEQVTIEFAVADTGIGIADDNIALIFENFQQAYSVTSSLYGGTGLGLAIVKQLIEKQGGTILVKSKLGQGSTFSFSLNFQKTNAVAEYEPEIVEMEQAVKDLRVLVVEDIELNQLLMTTILEDFGFACDVAADGQIAIEKIQKNTYDIVLMDLQMPVMNGFLATEHIRGTLKSTIPIIALTADVTTVDLAKCKAAGMSDYIAKPIDEKMLYNKIIGLVKTETMNDENMLADVGQTSKSKCTNLDYLNLRTKSNTQLMIQIISTYLEQTPTLVSVMKQGLIDKDWDILYSAAHKMIPSFSIMGVNSIFEDMARQVQEYAGKQLETGKITELVLQLEAICAQACSELVIELDTLKKIGYA
jgi:signal transduction histidine kinase/CheY-like chemotaxis protein